MKINSPAKINLFLCVTGKRPDGYHDIHSLMCGIALNDVLTLDFQAARIYASCSHPDVPEDDSNIACRAAAGFFEAWGRSGGVGIDIEKNIPVAAGLGGGSSNAATVLLALNTHYNFPFSDGELASQAVKLGADVPFFLHCRPAVATGVGEKLSFFREIQPYPIVLIHPQIRVRTADVYNGLNLGLTNCEQKLNSLPLNGGFDPIHHLCNDLETVTVSWFPEISEIKKTLTKLGAMGSLMSGSGPAVFGVFSNAVQARKAYNSLIPDKFGSCFLTRLLV
jgi:4-diphosphocytidyl-2-C-methyl-D-erythritol kinase